MVKLFVIRSFADPTMFWFEDKVHYVNSGWTYLANATRYTLDDKIPNHGELVNLSDL
jgi:hypothetical protein